MRCPYLQIKSSKLTVWWRLIPSFFSFSSTQRLRCHIKPIASLKEWVCQTTAKTNKQTPEKQRCRNQVCPWVLHTCGAWRGGTRHVCPESTRSVFIPSIFFLFFFIPALFVFSLCGWNAQIAFLRCRFPGGVCLAAGVSSKRCKARDWKEHKERKKNSEQQRREKMSGGDLPLSLNSCRNASSAIYAF